MTDSDLGLDLLGSEEGVGLHEPLHLDLDLLGYLPVHCTGAGSFLARCRSQDTTWNVQPSSSIFCLPNPVTEGPLGHTKLLTDVLGPDVSLLHLESCHLD